jgi:hypothetical protein
MRAVRSVSIVLGSAVGSWIVVDSARCPPDATALQKERSDFLGKKRIALGFIRDRARKNSRKIS